MRKTPQLKNPSRGIGSSELTSVSSGATLSVGNLLLSTGTGVTDSGNIDTALQLGPR
jgi:hypothetical protein